METIEKKKLLEHIINKLEHEVLMGTIDYRLWQTETLLRASEQNNIALTQSLAVKTIAEKRLAKAYELLDELQK